MRQDQKRITVATRGSGPCEISAEAERFVMDAGIASGLLTVFCPHTSCSLLLQENADPDVRTDLQAFFRRLVPDGMDWLVHTTEGPDDMPAHIKTALTQSSISIPVSEGRPVFGMWQGLYLFEHRARPHRREVVFHVLGE